MKQILLILAAILIAAVARTTSAQTTLSTTSVDWFNNSSTKLEDAVGTPLSAGTSANNDGDLIQLGYYDAGTSLNPFLGNWVPLTGAGPALTTIGDSSSGSGLADGLFDFSTTTWHWNSNMVDVYDPVFATAPYTTTSGITITTTNSTGAPPNGQILSIRFYDSNTVHIGTMFNAVSETGWTWSTPTDAGTNLNAISLSTGTPIWQNPATPFETTLPAIAIPEPSSIVLLTLGGAALASGCRRRVRA